MIRHRSSRRILPTLVLGLASILLPASLAAAVEIVPGQVYESGTSLSARDFGITTSVPAGWRAALPVGRSALVMERIAGGATILVVAEEMNERELQTEMRGIVDLDGTQWLRGENEYCRQADVPARARDASLAAGPIVTRRYALPRFPDLVTCPCDLPL